MIRNCEFCGFPVSGGGDRHKQLHCPPRSKPGGNRRARKRSRASEKIRKENVTRGAAITGTGKKTAGKTSKKAVKDSLKALNKPA